VPRHAGRLDDHYAIRVRIPSQLAGVFVRRVSDGQKDQLATGVIVRPRVSLSVGWSEARPSDHPTRLGLHRRPGGYRLDQPDDLAWLVTFGVS